MNPESRSWLIQATEARVPSLTILLTPVVSPSAVVGGPACPGAPLECRTHMNYLFLRKISQAVAAGGD